MSIIGNIIGGDGENKPNQEAAKTTQEVAVDPLASLGAQTKTVGSGVSPLKVFSDFGSENLKAFTGSLTDIGANYDAILNSTKLLQNSMGIGNARAAELKATIADATPEMLKLGLSTSESFKVLQSVPEKLGVNTILAKDTIVELGAASKMSGIDAGELADTFKSVGMELGVVAETMASVHEYAKGIGVNAEAVTKLVGTNLKQLNLYNFDNGVKGLASMAANATMLGVKMEKVFNLAEDLLSPEKAIEFSSTLQQLGVTSTELLDPLSAMDMAMNNPEKLSNEMVKVAQQFTKLKADGSGFEILPGAKLQLREVAKAMGMTGDELAEMALKSADFDMKMKQIKFPSFAASEEDRMLIANMSQMKDGKAVVQIANEEGGVDEVAVEDLTAEQLKQLQKEQADQNKTAEEIALEQLTVLEQIQANTTGGIAATKMGVATSGPISRYLETINETRLSLTKNTIGKVDTETIRGTANDVTQPLEEALVGFIKDPSITNLTKALESFGTVGDNMAKRAEDLLQASKDSAKNIFSELSTSYSKIYEGIGDKEGGKVTPGDISKLFKEQEDKMKELESKSKSESVSTSNVNVKYDITTTLKSDGSISDETLKGLIKQEDFGKTLISTIHNDTQTQDAIRNVSNDPMRN
jgi:hypothetical protein